MLELIKSRMQRDRFLPANFPELMVYVEGPLESPETEIQLQFRKEIVELLKQLPPPISVNGESRIPNPVAKLYTGTGLKEIPRFTDSYDREYQKFRSAQVRVAYRTLRRLVDSLDSPDRNLANNSFAALINLGPFAFPVIDDLINLANRHENAASQRIFIVAILSSLGVSGTSALPVLLKAAFDPQISSHTIAPKGIGRTGYHGAQLALPILIDKLNAQLPGTGSVAESILSQIGPNAISALPSLIALSSTGIQRMEDPAQSALHAIAPENEELRQEAATLKAEPESDSLIPPLRALMSKSMIEKYYGASERYNSSRHLIPWNAPNWFSITR